MTYGLIMGDVQVVYWELLTRFSFSIMGGVCKDYKQITICSFLLLVHFCLLYTSMGLGKCLCPDSDIHICGGGNMYVRIVTCIYVAPFLPALLATLTAATDIQPTFKALALQEVESALAVLINTVLPVFLPCLLMAHFITWQRSLKCHLRAGNIVTTIV